MTVGLLEKKICIILYCSKTKAINCFLHITKNCMHDEVGGCVEILQLFFTMMGHQQVLIKFKETRKGFYARGDWF